MKKHFVLILSGLISLGVFGQEPTTKKDGQNATATLEKDGKDPVCGMKVKKGTGLVSVHKEKQHGFCSKVCKEKFDKNPEQYVKK